MGTVPSVSQRGIVQTIALSSDSEVGAPFHDDCKIQIVWNAGFELFKDELTMIGVSRRDDLKGHFEI